MRKGRWTKESKREEERINLRNQLCFLYELLVDLIKQVKVELMILVVKQIVERTFYFLKLEIELERKRRRGVRKLSFKHRI